MSSGLPVAQSGRRSYRNSRRYSSGGVRPDRFVQTRSHFPRNGVNLRIIQLNARSIRNKMTELQKLAFDTDPDIICIQESWIRETPGEKFPVELKGFYPIWKNRLDSNGGGVVTFVKNSIPSVRIKVRDEVEGVVVKLLGNKYNDVTVANFYRPNPASPLSTADLEMFRSGIIVGDFNAQLTSLGYDNDCVFGSSLVDWLDSSNSFLLRSSNDPHTRSIARTIDGEVTLSESSPDLTIIGEQFFGRCSRTVLANQPYAWISSDHRAIITDVLGNTDSSPLRFYWNLNAADWHQFSAIVDEGLEYISNESARLNIDSVVSKITKLLKRAAVSSIPRGRVKNPVAWWSTSLQTLKTQCLQAHQDFKADPSSREKFAALKSSKATYWKALLDAKKSAIAENLASLNFAENTDRTWREVKSLIKGNADHRATVMNSNRFINGSAVFGAKQKAANIYGNFLRDRFTSRLSASRKQKLRISVQSSLSTKFGPVPDICADFALQEVMDAKVEIQSDAAGVDQVVGAWLRHLSNKSCKLLNELLFSRCWREGYVCQSWKKSCICPLDKGKGILSPDGFRPISLCSTLLKWMERVVARRLSNFGEINSLFPAAMFGYRKFRSTTDAAALIAATVENGFQSSPPKHTILITLDAEGAYDSVDNTAMIHKLAANGVSHNALRWLHSWLSGRTYKVVVDHRYSGKYFSARAGLPQGSCLSPVMYNFFTADLRLAQTRSDLPVPLLITYADDISILCSHSDITLATKMLQRALSYVQSWCLQWGVKLAPSKCEGILFSLSKSKSICHDKYRAINRNGHPSLFISDGDRSYQIPFRDCLKYLGFHFDRTLSWRQHLMQQSVKAAKRVNVLAAIGGKLFGAKQDVLMMIFKSCILPVLLYGMELVASWSALTEKIVDKIILRASRIILGVPKSSSINGVLLLTGLDTCSVISNYRSKAFAFRSISTNNNPLLASLTSNSQIKRLPNRPSIVDCFHYFASINASINTTIMYVRPAFFCYDGIISINLDSSSSSSSSADIVNSFNDSSWTTVYIDGSYDPLTHSGGIGGWVANDDYSFSGKVGGDCDSKFCESYSLLQSVRHLILKAQDGDRIEKVVIFCDCRDVLASARKFLRGGTACGFDADLLIALCDLMAFVKELVLQWVPGHADIAGNNIAHRLANAARTNDTDLQVLAPLTKSKLKNNILINESNRQRNHRWSLLSDSCTLKLSLSCASDFDPKNDNVKKLARHEQTVIQKLRLDRAPTRTYLSKWQGTSLCRCGNEQTVSHLLLCCPASRRERNSLGWRNLTLQNILFGDAKTMSLTCDYAVKSLCWKGRV
jgi:ribonuclease HI